MSRSIVFAGVGLAAFGVFPVAYAADTRGEIERAEDRSVLWTFSAGAENSRTDFDNGAEQSVWYAPVGFGLAFGGWSLGLETGYLDAELRTPSFGGRTITLPSIAGRPPRTITIPGTAPIERSVSGLSDTTLTARYDFLPVADLLAFALAGEVKLPTADSDEGLGSGETDYAVSAEVGGVGRFAPFLGVGYEWLGEPDGVTYDPSVFGYAGFDWSLSQRLTLGLAYDYAQSPVDALDDPQSASAALRVRLNENLRLSFTADVGLSESAPDQTLGVRLSARLP